MYSTFLWIALSGFGAHGNEVEPPPRWLNDYGTAKQAGRTETKPVIVVVSSGGEGWEKLSQSGKLGKQVNHILSDSYVCVYADITTADGWQLARSLGLTTGVGVVITDRTGRYMAFYHEGNLADENLSRYLQRYADPGRVFYGTESNPNGTLHTANPAATSAASVRC